RADADWAERFPRSALLCRHRLFSIDRFSFGWLRSYWLHCLAVHFRPGGRAGRQAALLQDSAANLIGQRRVVSQVLLCIFASLAQPPVAVAEPGAALLDYLVFQAQIQQVALAANAPVVHQVELRLFEWRRHLVFHYSNLDPRTDRFLTVLDVGDFANVHSY